MTDTNGGNECYSWYHYLWHLIAIRAVSAQPVDAEGAKYEIVPEAWDLLELEEDELPGQGEKIALIDVGVNDEHPNLAPRILGAHNFAIHPYGAVYEALGEPPAMANGPQPWVPMKRGLELPLDASLISDAAWNMLAAGLPPVQAAIVDSLRNGLGVKHMVPQASRLRYPGHGTACAGLMVGAPPGEDFDLSSVCGEIEELDEGPIPYWGVAPGADLLPIVVSAQPTAEQLIFAFLLAWDSGVSVIHFPREASDPWRAYKHSPGFGGTRYEAPGYAADSWDLFEECLERVSTDIPVVCAAGNNGYDHLIYPAKKADGTNGLIATGAVTYLARRASYSNYALAADTSSAVTIAAPSDDEEMYTRHQVRLDRQAPDWRDHNFAVHTALNPGLEVPYAPQALFTTDVPGPRGYADGVLDGLGSEGRELDDRGAMYTLFGGTSGASAIVAGSVALLQSKSRKDTGALMGGGAVKAKLLTSGATTVDWPWLPGAPVPVQVDAPNGDPGITFAEQFGAGVLDLTELLS